MAKSTAKFSPLHITVLTVSDTRTEDNDTSGQFLISALTDSGHTLVENIIVKDDIYAIRAIVSKWIAADGVDAIIVTGGTGFSGRDSTPEAISPLFDKSIDGFGELFRQLSYEDIGTSTIQSRSLAGFANNTVIFAVPGSTGACELAWNKILSEQLDSRHRPCNFYGVLEQRAV